MNSEIDPQHWVIKGLVTVVLAGTCLFAFKKGLQIMGNILGNSAGEASSSKEPDRPIGLRPLTDYLWELYRPEGMIDMDILFFHGLQLGGFEEAFWKAFVAKDDEMLIWPKEWLSLIFPNARILSVSYPKETDMFILGENLVGDIISDNNIGQNRPVFLVGHSVGGLLIKQFIISTVINRSRAAKRPREVERINMFLENLKGVFYYATPHEGSEIQSITRKLQNRSPILGLLKVVNTQRERINMEFRQYRSNLNLNVRTAAVGETLPTEYLGFNEIVVVDASARKDADIYYTFNGADHFTVCKARRSNDPIVIKKLALFILDTLRDASPPISVTYVPPKSDDDPDDRLE